MAYTTEGMVQSGDFGYEVGTADTSYYLYIGMRLPFMPYPWQETPVESGKLQNITLDRQISVDAGDVLTETWRLSANDTLTTHSFVSTGAISHVWQTEDPQAITISNGFPTLSDVFTDPTQNPQVSIGLLEMSCDDDWAATIQGIYYENSNDHEWDESPYTGAKALDLCIRDETDGAFPGGIYRAASAYYAMYLLAHTFNFMAYQHRNCRSFPFFTGEHEPV